MPSYEEAAAFNRRFNIVPKVSKADRQKQTLAMIATPAAPRTVPIVSALSVRTLRSGPPHIIHWKCSAMGALQALAIHGEKKSCASGLIEELSDFYPELKMLPESPVIGFSDANWLSKVELGDQMRSISGHCIFCFGNLV